jgi:hypothetical protein
VARNRARPGVTRQAARQHYQRRHCPPIMMAQHLRVKPQRCSTTSSSHSGDDRTHQARNERPTCPNDCERPDRRWFASRGAASLGGCGQLISNSLPSGSFIPTA